MLLERRTCPGVAQPMPCSSAPNLPPKLRILPSGMSASSPSAALRRQDSVLKHHATSAARSQQSPLTNRTNEGKIVQSKQAGLRHLGGTMVCWSGLCSPAATFASSLLHAMPADSV